ncbi:MAG: hypothetical protein GY792_18375 [Gammaproteobacteria bacterium]|nr:hypothetical protein [Gammaproteobacteria bacterium]
MQPQNTKRHLPPYGRELQQRTARDGLKNGIWICVGADAWGDSKIIRENYPDRAALVLPDDGDPTAFLWPVANHDVVILLSSDQVAERVHAIGVALVQAGANRVVVIGEIDNLPHRLTLFRPMVQAT